MVDPNEIRAFEVNGKIAASPNIGSNRHELFRNHLIIQGEDLLILRNPAVVQDARSAPGEGRDQGRSVPTVWGLSKSTRS
ncbi:hypothetical protein HFN70_27255 [Rhizobium laguerreae]|nr:hypothetical protein [Rhizobium laguerreae]